MRLALGCDLRAVRDLRAISLPGPKHFKALLQARELPSKKHHPVSEMAGSDHPVQPLPEVKALIFDVFGTAVDWRSTVTEALQKQYQKTGVVGKDIDGSTKRDMSREDWASFADEWRQSYYDFTKDALAAIVRGETVNKNVDEHLLDALKELLEKWGLHGLWDEESIRKVHRVWHYLDPWPDTVKGILTLNADGYQTCTLSNGNTELLTDMATHAKLEWTHIFSADLFKSFKPSPTMYLSAAKTLKLEPKECAMVAAHLGDLEAARKLGLRTVYVERSQEEQWPADRAAKAKDWVDIWIGEEEPGFLLLAQKLRGV